jgi:hypothetical protein
MFMLTASLVLIHTIQGIAPSEIELSETNRWAAASFEGRLLHAPPPMDAIEVVFNHGPVQPNARGEELLLLGGVSFSRGLYCHAPSRLIVRLSSPARQLEATVGVDDRAGGGTPACP